MKRILIFLFVTIALAMPSALFGKDFVVVIDPGHGGRDYGAVGKVTNEKTINLNVGLAVRDMLKNTPGVKVVMTRDNDTFVPLQERANIANRNHGDLFMSIHVNSVDTRSKGRTTVNGAAVYVLGLHRSQSNFEVAKRENSVMELEANYNTKYKGFDPNSAESYIMFELSQNKHLNQSISFANMAESQLCSVSGRKNNGIRQAGFWVLHASAMPAALVELDFICNPTVEKYLGSEQGIDEMARSLTNAICSYAGVKQGKTNKKNERGKGKIVITPQPCPEEVVPDKAKETATTWRVQFLTADRSLMRRTARFRGLEKVEEYRHDGAYKYTAGGDFVSQADAEKYAATVVRKKFPNAFVITWKNGKRI